MLTNCSHRPNSWEDCDARQSSSIRSGADNRRLLGVEPVRYDMECVWKRVFVAVFVAHNRGSETVNDRLFPFG